MDKYANVGELKRKLLEKGFYPAIVGSVLESMPTVEIVRCKNCTHRIEDIFLEGCFYCDVNNVAINPNDFCSWGEKAED